MKSAILMPILAGRGMRVCGGWFSGQLLDGDLEREKDRVRPQLDLFKAVGAPCIVYGEMSGSIQGVRGAPLYDAVLRVIDEHHARITHVHAGIYSRAS